MVPTRTELAKIVDCLKQEVSNLTERVSKLEKAKLEKATKIEKQKKTPHRS